MEKENKKIIKTMYFTVEEYEILEKEAKENYIKVSDVIKQKLFLKKKENEVKKTPVVNNNNDDKGYF